MPLERRELRGADEALRLPVEAARLAGRGRQPLDERAQERRDGREPAREAVAGVVVVAAEELVAALAGERDLDVPARELGDEVGRDRGRVRERLVEGLGQRGQELDGVRAEHELVVVGAVPLGDEAREAALVEGALVEADREGADVRDGLRRERGERARVDPAREQDADGHVRDQVGPDRVAQPLEQLLGELLLALRGAAPPASTGWGRA